MTVTNYIWDVENDSYLQETDGTDSTTVTYTNEPAENGKIVSQRHASTTHVFQFDGIGSTRELTDTSESTTDTFLYDAWGNELARSGTADLAFRYVGRLGYYYDSELGHNYVRARAYDPALARWTSRDPLWFEDGANMGIYAHNNPIISSDPTGLVWKPADCDDCPPLTCEQVQNKGLTADWPLADFLGKPINEELFPAGENDLGMKIGGLRCPVSYHVADCGLPKDSGRICSRGRGEKSKREIFICVQVGTTWCKAREFMFHALSIAGQICNAPKRQLRENDDGTTFLRSSCEDRQTEAYKVSCDQRLAQQCFRKNINRGYDFLIKKCIKEGVKKSCVDIPKVSTKTCKEVIDGFK